MKTGREENSADGCMVDTQEKEMVTDEIKHIASKIRRALSDDSNDYNSTNKNNDNNNDVDKNDNNNVNESNNHLNSPSTLSPYSVHSTQKNGIIHTDRLPRRSLSILKEKSLVHQQSSSTENINKKGTKSSSLLAFLSVDKTESTNHVVATSLPIELKDIVKERSPSNSNESLENNENTMTSTNTEIQFLKEELECFKKKLNSLEKLLHNQENTSHISPLHLNREEVPKLMHQQKVNNDRVFINIGGIRHETYRSTLKNIPDTRLSWIAEESATHSPEYDPINGEFFFDRHPQVFSHILNYYRTGNLHVPYDVCGPLFEEELLYWGMDDTQVESCCWSTYRQHRDAQETLKDFEGIEFERDYDEDSEPDLESYGFSVRRNEDDLTKDEMTWYQRWQPVMWKLMEDPRSSKTAKILAYISMTLIMLSVLLFCLETINYFKQDSLKLVFTIIEGFFALYFTIELVVRFTFCPNKKLFLKGVMNWIDLFAIIPFFVTTVMEYGFQIKNLVTFLQIIRVIRVFRIIKLTKHSVGLQILGHTLKASFRELLLLIFFLTIGSIIFSSLVYFFEFREKNTKFVSIPHSFWWAVITMTTVGYGDMVPSTVGGKIVGGLCSIAGVLMIALPVPVIVNNFNLYYSHAQARLKLPKKKRRMLCGAANALKGPAIEEFERRRQSISEHSIQNGDLLSQKSDEDNSGPSNEVRLAELRIKRFSRRDSNIFNNNTTLYENSLPTTPVTIKRTSYALNKRRSLLPTIATLPEIEP